MTRRVSSGKLSRLDGGERVGSGIPPRPYRFPLIDRTANLAMMGSGGRSLSVLHHHPRLLNLDDSTPNSLSCAVFRIASLALAGGGSQTACVSHGRIFGLP